MGRHCPDAASTTVEISHGPDEALTLQRLAAIVRTSADAIMGEAIDGIITDWNPAAERLYGYSAAEIVGQHRSILEPPEDEAEVNQWVSQISRGESLQGLEAVDWTRDGRRIEVFLTISPIWNESGEIVAT